MKPFGFILIALSILFLSRFRAFGTNTVFDARSVSNLTSELGFIDHDRQIAPGSAFRDYLGFYGMDPKFVKKYGYFLSQGRKIFCLITSPPLTKTRATIVLLHGYEEHSGNLLGIATRFLEEGYAVCLYDMPGHGLSDGKRGSIDDFSGYSSVLCDFLKIAGDGPNPVYFIGHSTACAAALETLHSDPGAFKKVVFVAPLVHISFWEIISGVYQPLSSQLKEIPRVFFDNSGDREYEDYVKFMEKKDPLQVRTVPLKWIKALIDWNRRLPDYPVISNGVCVIQGDADIVLDWKHNIGVLRKKFRTSEVHMIKGGKHILFHETPERLKEVLGIISVYLAE